MAIIGPMSEIKTQKTKAFKEIKFYIELIFFIDIF